LFIHITLQKFYNTENIRFLQKNMRKIHQSPGSRSKTLTLVTLAVSKWRKI